VRRRHAPDYVSRITLHASVFLTTAFTTNAGLLYHHAQVLHLINNAVKWAAPVAGEEVTFGHRPTH
jgi:trehalose utilization protein